MTEPRSRISPQPKDLFMTRQLSPARPALASILVVAAALATALVLFARPAHAVVTVSPASGGTGISADDAGTTWTDLGPITIDENLMDDFAASQAGVTLILTAPAGFEFNTAQATNVTSTGTDLSALAVAYPSSTTLELTFTTDGVADDMDSVVIGGGTAIQVRAEGAHARLTYWCPVCQNADRHDG